MESRSKDTNNREESPNLPPVERFRELLPWRRAWEMNACQLYWIPVSTFPVPALERRYLLRFVEVLANTLEKRYSIQPETFLQMKVVQPALRDEFLRTATEFNPIFGLSRRPGSALPGLPDQQYIQDLQTGRQTYNGKDLQPDYCYWFLYKEHARQREVFLGHGGLTTVFLAADPATQAPKISIPARVRRDPKLRAVLARHDIQRMLDAAFSLEHPFLLKTKELFGKELELDPQYPGLLFVLPLLDTGVFFERPAKEVSAWFDLFDVYLNESPRDRGIVLASKADIEDEVVAIVLRLREEGVAYTD